jgi:hypothetical protein
LRITNCSGESLRWSSHCVRSMRRSTRRSGAGSHGHSRSNGRCESNRIATSKTSVPPHMREGRVRHVQRVGLTAS